MMRRIWTRIVVASLILLGDGALASGNDQKIDDNYAADGYAAQLLQPAFSGDELLLVKPPLSGPTAVIGIISTAPRPVTGTTSHARSALKYRLFSPRAPPTPA